MMIQHAKIIFFKNNDKILSTFTKWLGEQNEIRFDITLKLNKALINFRKSQNVYGLVISCSHVDTLFENCFLSSYTLLPTRVDFNFCW